MGAWYWIGVVLGIAAAFGVVAAAVLPRAVFAAAAAVVAGLVLGYLVREWDGLAEGAIGAVAGVVGAAPVIAGALRRGGTRAGLAVFAALAALVVAALAFVPVLGYIEVIALPLLGLRQRARAPERHAGLRTLARD
jgi:hypothetical protein